MQGNADREDFNITLRRLEYFSSQIDDLMLLMRREPMPLFNHQDRLANWKTLVQWVPDHTRVTFVSLTFRANPESQYFGQLVKLAQETGNTVRGYFQRQIRSKYDLDSADRLAELDRNEHET